MSNTATVTIEMYDVTLWLFYTLITSVITCQMIVNLGTERVAAHTQKGEGEGVAYREYNMTVFDTHVQVGRF